LGAHIGEALVLADVFARERGARTAAEEANRTKDDFLAMLGHELRNPLAPIVSALNLMRLRDNEPASNERVVIERHVSHLVRLVDDLLDISRFRRGQVELKLQHLELADVVARAIELARPLLEQRCHHLEVSVVADGLSVNADPQRLTQVVANLLMNAARFTERNGRITIAAARAAGEVVLRVGDTGVGIAPERLSKVFGLFSQEKQSIERAQGGLGLGLAIARGLMDLHGGSISAHSAGSGRGSEFTIRLPWVRPLAPVASPAATTSAAAASASLAVLIVDDNEDAAELLAECLAEFGHRTRIAHDGPAALRVVQDFTPDVAVLDIGLPVMDGYELALRLRQHPGLGEVRLLALTGYGQASDRQRSRTAGFDAHLVKPIDLAQLEAAICGGETERRAAAGATAAMP
jgi:CheY-like chemotaxis protein/nitrogen-specific signal transduction histidine kinase